MELDKEKKSELPYDIEFELLGFFEVSKKVEKERRAALVLANGASILYSAAREVIVTMTGRFMKGHVTMPGVNFIDDAKRLEEEIQEAAALARSQNRSDETILISGEPHKVSRPKKKRFKVHS